MECSYEMSRSPVAEGTATSPDLDEAHDHAGTPTLGFPSSAVRNRFGKPVWTDWAAEWAPTDGRVRLSTGAVRAPCHHTRCQSQGPLGPQSLA